jgi:dsDNA-binding SOS-regulon protein
MMNLRKHLHSAILGWGLAVAVTAFVSVASAQQAPGQGTQNPDLTRQELSTFDQFLDKHPDIDKQLTANPSLINNKDFVEDHPELGKFLVDHKEIREEIKENPINFMHREQRFDNAENRTRNPNPNPDVTGKEVAGFDHFLDKHPDLDKQLEANPGLVNDQSFLKHHHDLRAFLQDHPEIREELNENASQFMRREQRFDAAGNNTGKSQLTAKNPDLTKKEVAAFDDFLDHHKNIDKDLRKDPNLVNDAKFVKEHSDLRKFLEKNPGVGDELRENPSNLMRQEARFDRSDRDRHADRDHDKDKHKVASKEHESALEQKERMQTLNPH